MTTKWTTPREGATLAQLIDAFPNVKRLQELASLYGTNAKGGLMLVEGDLHPCDYGRLTGVVFASHVKGWATEDSLRDGLNNSDNYQDPIIPERDTFAGKFKRG